jgi:RNA polymerase sigma-70 factor (ECF subfamily)
LTSTAFSSLSDDALFDAVLSQRSQNKPLDPPLGMLLERWRRPAYLVIRRVGASYRRGAPEDEPEVFQESARKLIERGLDQFHGVSEGIPGKNASPKTFFLRIVKHAAIDRYRAQRDFLANPPEGDDDGPSDSPPEVAVATTRARRAEERNDAQEVYWTAFERLRAEHPNEAAAWDLYHHQDVEDHEQCAKQLNISVVNSYKRVSRAQAHLRRYLIELAEEKG